MLKFDDVSFSYGKTPVLSHFSMELRVGETLALMGPSGCGKTTILSLAAGLIKPTSGSITRPEGPISCAFQEPRLFPWLTVEENLAAILPRHAPELAQIPSLLCRFDLEEAAKQYPRELSGGMKSRVSLARALLGGASLFLLDEPFAALDPQLRRSLTLLLRDHFEAIGATVLFVTHQREDAELLAHRILELSPVVTTTPKAD